MEKLNEYNVVFISPSLWLFLLYPSETVNTLSLNEHFGPPSKNGYIYSKVMLNCKQLGSETEKSTKLQNPEKREHN